MSCVTLLQLLSYFSAEGRQPKNGIVLLFNNAEEDGLLGANAFGYSPLLSFCHTFVNLEGAGAGGRAMLFRTTDLQVARAYGQSPHPFGSVVAANAFERGVIKSGTDYQVFAGIFGQRGSILHSTSHGHATTQRKTTLDTRPYVAFGTCSRRPWHPQRFCLRRQAPNSTALALMEERILPRTAGLLLACGLTFSATPGPHSPLEGCLRGL